MSATPSFPEPSTAASDAICRSCANRSVGVAAPGPLALDAARVGLAKAADALKGWSVRDGHNYVKDGHEAIRLIDAAVQDLYRVREKLVSEIRVDENERAARVDRMIAEFKSQRPEGLDSSAPPAGGAS